MVETVETTMIQMEIIIVEHFVNTEGDATTSACKWSTITNKNKPVFV